MQADPFLCHHARPVVNKTGFRPHARIPYSFGRSPDGTPFPTGRIRCVTRAFDAWTRANEEAGLHVRFVPGPGGIVVRMDNPGGLILRARRGGAWADGVRSPDGFLEQALIWLTADPKMVDSCEGFTKVMVHELGHLHGLADNGRYRGPSVMNRAAHKNDRGGWISLSPTPCDAGQALKASQPAPAMLHAEMAAAIEPER